ncbi:hypothetical protein TSTA_025700 [Talaromyces stipitatus ATCC 10500]|uniref:Uncharacterized protein n=1 Tax=Talaromyces stipitatus (strain ATCC 10500 / CBS 375.48 / QM 6759 / NRRL 1006) TaxID=441959 RepID=B8M4Q9_TALSN|nr:uncharacterized protein TSTA_025700 [Talaromyces stipitatus ATCC 10500]EED19254.1 hypothetical protein TSTA_025700 [Talaromyces stipitatus ATCC 10500]
MRTRPSFPHHIYNDSDTALRYCRLIEDLAGQYPGYSYLDFYLNSENVQPRKEPYQIDLVQLSNGQSDAQFDINTFTDVNKLIDQVRKNDSHKLIILEDPTPEVIAHMGSELEIDPQFWADFLVGSFWFDSGKLRIDHRKEYKYFQDDSLLEKVWLLPTDARQQDHCCIRFVAQRALDRKDNAQMKKYKSLEKTHGITDGAETGPPNYANTVPEHCKLTLWNNFRNRRGNEKLMSQSSFKAYLDWQRRPQTALKSNASLREIINSQLNEQLNWKAFRNAAAYAPDYLLIDLCRLIASFWVAEIESQHLYLFWVEKFYQREITRQKQELTFQELFAYNWLSEKLNADDIELWSHRTATGCYSHSIKELSQCCDTQKPREAQLSTLKDTLI